jgi:transcriptional regulator with XRE-family HTH domain/mannose-6-phosphate isomerase-like protein (cupin superfamily)
VVVETKMNTMATEHREGKVEERPHGAGRRPAEIGRQIAALRRERRMKIVDLSREAGISPSMISQIERGQALPSVGTLHAIAGAFALTVHDLFPTEDAGSSAGAVERTAAEPVARSAKSTPTAVAHAPRHGAPVDRAAADPDGPVVRGDRREFSELAGGVRLERLTSFDLPDVDIVATVYRPGAASSERLYRHEGRELHLVTDGRLVIELGFQRYELAAGDSITFDSTVPHRYSNPFEEAAHGVSVMLPGRAR